MTSNNNYNIGDDFNLELEFASLGFDFKSMLNSIRYISDRAFLLTTHGYLGCSGMNADRIYFVFTVIQLGKLHHSIYNIQVTLLTSLPNLKRIRIILTKEYLSDNARLPTKQTIVNEFGQLRNNPNYLNHEELN